MSRHLKSLLKRWPEIWSVPLGLFILYWSYAMLWTIFPFAAPYPPESLQKFLFSGFVLSCFNGLAWLGMKLNLPQLYRYYKQAFFPVSARNTTARNSIITPNSDSLKSLTSWQKSCLLFASYFLYLFLLTAIAALM